MDEVNLSLKKIRLDDVNVASPAEMQNPTVQPDNPTVQPDGMVLFDSHAEVVARRALKK